MNKYLELLCCSALLITGALIGVLCLNAYPLWWDEGWNLILAKNWMLDGFYGEKIIRQASAVSLAGSPTVVLPIGLSFEYFGIGAWQARLPALLFFIASLLMLYLLAKDLMTRSAAFLSLLASLLLGAHVHLYAPLLGTQAVGEIVVLFYVLLGYLLLSRSLTSDSAAKEWGLLVLAALAWGLAFYTKNQIRPFLLLATLAPALYAILRKDKPLAGKWFCMAIAPFILNKLIHVVRKGLLISPQDENPVELSELYKVTALVFDSDARHAALTVVGQYALPLVFSLLFFFVYFLANRKNADKENGQESILVSLWFLLAAWGSWFLLLSVGWPRYLYPTFFLGNIFIGISLHLAYCSLKNSDSTKTFAGIYLAAILLSALPSTWQTPDLLLRMQAPSPHDSTVEAARMINEKTKVDALIETYETELFFLLARPYHHPPDQVHLALNKRRFLKESVELNYDALAKSPDVLIVGPVARAGGLYTSVLKSGAFAPVANICHAERACPYQIYARKTQ